LFIPSGSTVYISLLSSGKLGFFCFGWQGYLKINNNLIGYEANYTGSVSGSDWITYYYKGIGDAYYASTSSSYSSSWVKYKNNTSLVDNGYWVDITDLVSLNATNNFTFYHYTDNPIGYKIRIIE